MRTYINKTSPPFLQGCIFYHWLCLELPVDGELKSRQILVSSIISGFLQLLHFLPSLPHGLYLNQILSTSPDHPVNQRMKSLKSLYRASWYLLWLYMAIPNLVWLLQTCVNTHDCYRLVWTPCCMIVMDLHEHHIAWLLQTCMNNKLFSCYGLVWIHIVRLLWTRCLCPHQIHVGTLSSDGVLLGGEVVGLDVAVRVEASWMELMPLQQSVESSLSLSALQQLKTWGGDGNLQPARVLIRTWPCRPSNLGLPGSRTIGNNSCLLFISHPVLVSLL